MKQCPVCKNTYTDDSLTFCLSDGARLISSYDPQRTQQLPGGVNPTEPANHGRVTIPVDSPSIATQIAPPIVVTTPPPVRKGCSPVLVGVLFLLLGVFAIGGIVVAYFASKQDLFGLNKTPTPTATPIGSPGTNSNSFDDQKKSPTKTPTATPNIFSVSPTPSLTPSPTPSLTPSPTPPANSTTAKVNSPGDGFLAMRSGPSSATGYQIMKIPHGATINVYSCLGSTSIGGKTGRWCQVGYAGSNGWAFDAWLIY